MNRDNNLGMWTRGPNNGGESGDYITYSGPEEYTDDMSPTTMLLSPSRAFTLATVSVTSLSLLSYVTPLTLVL